MANFAGSAVEPDAYAGAYDVAGGSAYGDVGSDRGDYISPAGTLTDLEAGFGDAAPLPPEVPQYLQRLWDTGLVAYVYFTRESTDPTTPALAPGDTEPSNTGAFDFNNHAILAEV